MRRKLALATLLAAGVSSAAPAVTLATATGNHGQPNQNCESQPSGPPGFQTSGFQHATMVYAGAGKSTGTPASPKAVSQYDVACFQLSSR